MPSWKLWTEPSHIDTLTMWVWKLHGNQFCAGPPGMPLAVPVLHPPIQETAKSRGEIDVAPVVSIQPMVLEVPSVMSVMWMDMSELYTPAYLSDNGLTRPGPSTSPVIQPPQGR